MTSYLTTTWFWTRKGATKASLFIPWQRCARSWAVRLSYCPCSDTQFIDIPWRYVANQNKPKSIEHCQLLILCLQSGSKVHTRSTILKVTKLSIYSKLHYNNSCLLGIEHRRVDISLRKCGKIKPSQVRTCKTLRNESNIYSTELTVIFPRPRLFAVRSPRECSPAITVCIFLTCVFTLADNEVMHAVGKEEKEIQILVFVLSFIFPTNEKDDTVTKGMIGRCYGIKRWIGLLIFVVLLLVIYRSLLLTPLKQQTIKF